MDRNIILTEKIRLIKNHIVSTPDTCSGDPRIIGTRLTVKEVVDAICNGDEEEIIEDYPYLTKDDIDACVAHHLEHLS